MTAKALAILLLAAAMAGCSDDTPSDAAPAVDGPEEGADDPVPTPGADPEPRPPTEPGTPGPQPNLAPTLEFTSDVAGGVAPLTVTFSMDGADPEGDALTWSLDVDSDGTAESEGDTLPATHEHLFETVGVYTATLMVSDGQNTTQGSFEINVTAEEQVPAPAPLVYAGTVIGTGLGCTDPDDPAAWWFGGDMDIDIESSLWGAQYRLEPLEVEAWWWLGEGTDDPTEYSPEDGEGQVPEETTSVHICVDQVASGTGIRLHTAAVDWTLTIWPLP